MKILVTGANGYFGAQVIDALLSKAQHQVIGISRDWKNVSNIKGLIKASADLCGDLKPLSGLNNIDVVIHLAAIINVGSDEAALIEKNNLMLTNLLTWVKGKGIKKFIFVSSMTVFENAGQSKYLNEATPLLPPHHYGLSKLLGEHTLRIVTQDSGMHGAVIRFPGLYGANRKRGLIFKCVDQMAQQQDLNLDLKGLGNWDFLHVDDAAQMLVSFIEKYNFKPSFRIFQAGYGDVMHLDQLIKCVKGYLSAKSKVKILNKKDYIPCAMDPTTLKAVLKRWPFDRKKSLLHYMKENKA